MVNCFLCSSVLYAGRMRGDYILSWPTLHLTHRTCTVPYGLVANSVGSKYYVPVIEPHSRYKKLFSVGNLLHYAGSIPAHSVPTTFFHSNKTLHTIILFSRFFLSQLLHHVQMCSQYPGSSCSPHEICSTDLPDIQT